MLREISPAENVSCDEYLTHASDWTKNLIAQIRTAKMQGQRPVPSATLIDYSSLLSSDVRRLLLDKVASLVDENLCGRSEMCMQFAALVQLALTHLKISACTFLGTAIYYSHDQEIFRWDHAWVRVGKEVIDGNLDSLYENPVVPKTVIVAPYWGQITMIPSDRRLREDRSKLLPPDNDVSDIWWPELQTWLDESVLKR